MINKIPVTRVIEVELLEYEGKYFSRTREIAHLLEIKQPFEFNRDIKDYSNDFILKDNQTLGFRRELDEGRTTFIELKKLREFLLNGVRQSKVNQTKLEELLMFLNGLYPTEYID